MPTLEYGYVSRGIIAGRRSYARREHSKLEYRPVSIHSQNVDLSRSGAGLPRMHPNERRAQASHSR